MHTEHLLTRVFKLSFFVALLFAISTLLISTQMAHAESTEQHKIQTFINTEEIKFEVEPPIKNGTTLVPFRALFEQFGLDVDWHPQDRVVTGTKDGLEIKFTIDQDVAIVNGQRVQLSQSAQIIDDYTMVPLRFVGEATGAFVHWSSVTREISIFTEVFLTENNLTRESLLKLIAEIEADIIASPPDREPAPSEEPLKPDVTIMPIEDPVDIQAIKGMYYGFRSDVGGYECGGICWDIYTFLPDNLIFIGAPPEGGAETIDCKRDDCLSYEIKNGELLVNDDESYEIGKTEDGNLVINQVKLQTVTPASSDLKLAGTYKYISYTGLIGISPYSSSQTVTIAFDEDGRFESSNLSLATLDTIDSRTDGAHATDNSGTYAISGNTITLTSNDGTIKKSLFFVHDNVGQTTPEDIQIGKNMYYTNLED